MAMPMAAATGHAAPIAAVCALPMAVPGVLGVGAFLKNTLCLGIGKRALLSDDVGSLETVEAVRTFHATAEALVGMAGGGLMAVAHDLHPDFPSTRYAAALAEGLGIRAVPVQHHHAHVAAVMAEHARSAPVLGLALDGFGLGDDGGSWGGELLRVDRAGFLRLGHLAPLRQPGADRAAREPWRMAAAALHALGRGAEIAPRFAAQNGAAVVARMLERNIHSPETSSCGRLFDAACGLLGVLPVARFEGEAPMALERLAVAPVVDPAGWRIAADGVLDLLPLLDRLAGMPPDDGANLFHGTLAAALAAWVGRAADATGIREVVLAGGCFFNRVLCACLGAELEAGGITPLRSRALSPGDPAISLGQVWAAALAMDGLG
jgi:hydrogenase maturation protein HypF